MKATIGDKIGASLDKFRLQLPKQEESKPLVGVVVPDPVPHEPTKPNRVDLYYMGHTPGAPSIDEGQLAGELLDWLFKKGYFKESVIFRTSLIVVQKEFFKERDQ